MLRIQHCTLTDDKEHLLLKDASFCFDNNGFISIYSNQPLLHQRLSEVLAGIAKPSNGTLQYNNTLIQDFYEDECARYRSVFVSYLCDDFQVLKDKTLYENIEMGLEYPKDKIIQLLERFHLVEKKEVLAEDLTFEQQMKMVIIRTLIRNPNMIVFNQNSCPFSNQELTILYKLLEVISKQILVIVIGSKHVQSWSNRIIEIENTIIISDSMGICEVSEQVNHAFQSFSLSRTKVEEIAQYMCHRLRWKLRFISLLCMILFMSLSATIFSTTLDVTDIEMGLLKKQKLSLLAIEKHAVGNDGRIYEKQYNNFTMQDIERLEQKLKGDITLGYTFANKNQAIYSVYGDVIRYRDDNSLNTSTIIEATSHKELGLSLIIGRYPSTTQEVALSSQQAYGLLKETILDNESYQNSDDQNRKMLGCKIGWYGTLLTITGIIPEQQQLNKNLDFQIDGYAGIAKNEGSLLYHSMYVKKGFVKEQEVMQQRVFLTSQKRFIQNNTIVSFDNIYPINRELYYYNGEQTVENADLSKNEVLIDFQLALNMGYRTTYLEQANDDSLSEKERFVTYQKFCDEWIGEDINVQAYGIVNSPSNSSIMSRKQKIKGFVMPVSFEYELYYAKGEDRGSVYLNSTLLSLYEQENTSIQEVYYHPKNDSDLKSTLDYLHENNEYSAFLTNSSLLQFFLQFLIVDLKKMSIFLLSSGVLALLAFLYMFIMIMKSGIEITGKEMTSYYLFGEKKSTIQHIYFQMFKDIVRKKIIFGWLCGTLLLALFVILIFVMLSLSKSAFLSLLVPIGIAVVLYGMMRLVLLLVLDKQELIETSKHER